MDDTQKELQSLRRQIADLKAQLGQGDAPPVSPLAPKNGFPQLPQISGVEFATCEAGVRYSGRPDVMLARLAPGSSIAGVFTRSATRAAPVLDCQDKIGGDPSGGAAIIVNSGNANAFTGQSGRESVAAITMEVANVLQLDHARVFSSSTGVIGETLPHDKVTAKLEELKSSLSDDGIEAAANAIMTTDTYPKGATAEHAVGDKTVRIAGIAKGSGMIAPDMATMLCYVFTDATVSQDKLQAMLNRQNARSFNSITVDSDTSTSDTVLVAATGASGVDVTHDPEFERALRDVLTDLAHQVVRDGEGATKFVKVTSTGARNHEDAVRAARAVADSPLVKTAVAGEDPNWGRIVMAIGKSGAEADRDKLSIWLGDILVAENGWVADSYREAEGAKYMQQEDIVIRFDLGIGEGSADIWTCDLTHGYITINADYRS